MAAGGSDRLDLDGEIALSIGRFAPQGARTQEGTMNALARGRRADSRVRIRIFAHLKEAGLTTPAANRLACRVVRAMVKSGPMPHMAVKLAGLALGKTPQHEKGAAVLIEPTAMDNEFDSVKTSGPGTARGPGGSGARPRPGRPGHMSARRGPASARGFGAHPTGTPGIRLPPGGAIDFAIIEPIMYRREIQGWIGRGFSRSQFKQLAADADRALNAFGAS